MKRLGLGEPTAVVQVSEAAALEQVRQNDQLSFLRSSIHVPFS